MNVVKAAQKLSAFLATTQQNRLLRLSFPRGDEPSALLVVNSLEAYEALSCDFKYDLEILSDDPQIALKDVAGKLVCVELVRSDGAMRYFTGHVFEFRYAGTDAGFARYKMTLGPWLAYLRYRQNNYIFHRKTRTEQTRMVFEEYGNLRNWDIRLTGDDPEMTDAIQFAESDYNYVHRRWEECGWHYWYEHTAEGHQLILSDDSTRVEPVDGNSTILYQIESGSMDEDVISRFDAVRQVASSEFTVASFDFKNPRPTRESIPTLNKQGDVVPRLEVYEYTGAYGYRDNVAGDKLARRRMEEIESGAKHFEGAGDNPFLQVRRWFQLDNTYGSRSLQNKEESQFMLTAIHHSASNNYEQEGVGASYSNTFECQRKTIPWRPGRDYNSQTTRILSPQTALVVGPAGQEIHTDEYGRVRVQFHWDREGEYDERSSAWVRVSSDWAGSNYGFMALPRIGQEVIVQFLDGNCDRPIITGRVYNAQQMPPWELESQHALMGFRSKELFGSGFNHLIMDDTAEQIQTQLSSTHQLSQLNLGYITRIPGTVGRKDFRGEGFELRTDGWGAVRAGSGLFLSADARGNAQSTQCDIKEAKKQLEEALSFMEGMSGAAEKATAVAADCERQKELLQQRIDELQHSVILASAPAGIALTTPTDLQLSATENLINTAGGHYDISVMKQYTLAVGDIISMFSQTNGIKQIAAKGKIETQAQDNNVEITASKDIKIASASSEVVVSAPKKLTLACGGAYIKLEGGGIELGCPSAIINKSASVNMVGPASKSIPPPDMPEAGKGMLELFHNYANSEAVKAGKYTVVDSTGQVRKGVLDDQGYALVSGLSAGAAKITFDDDGRDPTEQANTFDPYPQWPEEQPENTPFQVIQEALQSVSDLIPEAAMAGALPGAGAVGTGIAAALGSVAGEAAGGLQMPAGVSNFTDAGKSAASSALGGLGSIAGSGLTGIAGGVGDALKMPDSLVDLSKGGGMSAVATTLSNAIQDNKLAAQVLETAGSISKTLSSSRTEKMGEVSKLLNVGAIAATPGFAGGVAGSSGGGGIPPLSFN